jgi:hypothetical protein
MINSLKIEKVEDLNYEFNRLLEQQPLEKVSYYQFSLFANIDGKFHYSFYTHWIGWTDDSYKHEVREPSLINPEVAIRQFQTIEEPLLVINNIRDLTIFLYFLGGNALVETSLGDKYLGHILKPTNLAYMYDKGFVDVETIPEPMLNRAPTPKLRMSIFKRDNMRCKICGASPKNNEHVELHLHHIIPFGNGGLTEENNLITLCHTCHKGLEPHLDYSLFNLIGVEMLSARRTSEDYTTRIRQNVEAAIKRLNSQQLRKKNCS